MIVFAHTKYKKRFAQFKRGVLILKILIIPGDGIGPEITAATRMAVDAIVAKYQLEIDVQEADCGLARLKRYGTTLRDEDLECAKTVDGVILGPMSIQDYPSPAEGGVHVTATLRSALELYANIRPSYLPPGNSGKSLSDGSRHCTRKLRGFLRRS